MTASEVREVMRRLWSNSGSLLRHFYALDQRLRSPLLGHSSKSQQSIGAFKEAYHMFFVQTVLVPPNNVRPLSRMGELSFEHPQNTALTQASRFDAHRRPDLLQAPFKSTLNQQGDKIWRSTWCTLL